MADLRKIRRKIRSEGLGTLIRRRLDWYSGRFRVNNPLVGKLVEWCGNKVRMDGLVYSVDTPNITRGHKSTLFFGLHEIEERILTRKWLRRDLPVIELGGGLGVVSCLTNRLLNAPDGHVVVEANPYMVPVLTRNRELNRARFAIISKAVAHGVATVRLPIDPEFVGSNLASVGAHGKTVEVAATTLCAVADQHGFAQMALIADIEGAEEDVILQDIPQLGDRLRLTIMEMHPYVLGTERVERLLQAMESYGFTLKERMGEGDVFCVVHSRD